MLFARSALRPLATRARERPTAATQVALFDGEIVADNRKFVDVSKAASLLDTELKTSELLPVGDP